MLSQGLRKEIRDKKVLASCFGSSLNLRFSLYLYLLYLLPTFFSLYLGLIGAKVLIISADNLESGV
jgi:hypothetical protein